MILRIWVELLCDIFKRKKEYRKELSTHCYTLAHNSLFQNFFTRRFARYFTNNRSCISTVLSVLINTVYTHN